MRNALRDYQYKLSSLNGAPAAHVRDPRAEMEYLVQITDERDGGGRYQITALVCKPDEGVRFPDSIPHRTLSEIAAEVLGRKEPAARGGNRYKGPDPAVLRDLIEKGYTRSELSQKLGRSPYTVDSWLKRARRMDPTFPTTITKTGKRREASARQKADQAELRAEQHRAALIEAERVRRKAAEAALHGA
mgnify:FL=1